MVNCSNVNENQVVLKNLQLKNIASLTFIHSLNINWCKLLIFQSFNRHLREHSESNFAVIFFSFHDSICGCKNWLLFGLISIKELLFNFFFFYLSSFGEKIVKNWGEFVRPLLSALVRMSFLWSKKMVEMIFHDMMILCHSSQKVWTLISLHMTV